MGVRIAALILVASASFATTQALEALAVCLASPTL